MAPLLAPVTSLIALGLALALGTRIRRHRKEVAEAARVRVLYDITSEGEGPIDARIDRALELATSLLGLELGIVSQIDPAQNRYVVAHCHAPGTPLASGAEFELGATYCSIALESGDLVAIDEMRRSSSARHPCYQAFGLESYIGIPFRVEGLWFGTLNFSSKRPRRPGFSQADRNFVRLLARWVARSMAAEEQERQARETEVLQRALWLAGPPMLGLVIDADGRVVEVRASGAWSGPSPLRFRGSTLQGLFGSAASEEILAVLDGEREPSLDFVDLQVEVAEPGSGAPSPFPARAAPLGGGRVLLLVGEPAAPGKARRRTTPRGASASKPST